MQIAHHVLHGLHVIVAHHGVAGVHVLNEHQGHAAVLHGLHAVVIEGALHQDHPGALAALAMLKIGQTPAVLQKSDLIAMLRRLQLDALQHLGEELVGQQIVVENTDVVAALGFQQAGRLVGLVAHFPGHLAHVFRPLRTDAGAVVQRPGYRCNGQAAAFRHHFDGYHSGRPLSYGD